MMYRCLLDGKPVAVWPPRHLWIEAARDAVLSGHATWNTHGGLTYDEHVTVAPLKEPTAYHRGLATHMAAAQEAVPRRGSHGRGVGYVALIVFAFVVWIAFRVFQ